MMKRVHRVGTITCGMILLIFGILFMLRMFLPELEYQFIFGFWPLILIFLGIEILIGHIRTVEEKIIYDKGAIFLTMLLTVFAMGMACADLCFQYAAKYL